MNNLMNPKYPEGKNLFKDQNILITAAAGSGIGFSTAKRFVEEGANIFISDVHQGRLDEAIQSLRKLDMGEVNGCLCNVTKDEEIESMFKKAISCYSTFKWSELTMLGWVASLLGEYDQRCLGSCNGRHT